MVKEFTVKPGKLPPVCLPRLSALRRSDNPEIMSHKPAVDRCREATKQTSKLLCQCCHDSVSAVTAKSGLSHSSIFKLLKAHHYNVLSCFDILY